MARCAHWQASGCHRFCRRTRRGTHTRPHECTRSYAPGADSRRCWSDGRERDGEGEGEGGGGRGSGVLQWLGWRLECDVAQVQHGSEHCDDRRLLRRRDPDRLHGVLRPRPAQQHNTQGPCDRSGGWLHGWSGPAGSRAPVLAGGVRTGVREHGRACMRMPPRENVRAGATVRRTTCRRLSRCPRRRACARTRTPHTRAAAEPRTCRVAPVARVAHL